MATPYSRGSAFERRVKAHLTDEGFVCAKTAGSKSCFDILAVRSDGNGKSECLLVQAKLNGRIDPHEREALWREARRAGGKAILAENVRGAIKYWLCHIERGRGLEFAP